MSKLNIVVDADIARSSGETNFPESRCCRELLECIDKNGHIIAMCSTLNEEWKKHQSSYARKWLVKMISRKRFKRVDHDNGFYNQLYDLELQNHGIDDNERELMLKDSHLIDCAINADRFIASKDNRAFSTFRKLYVSLGLEVLEDVYWVHPINHSIDIHNYLQHSQNLPSTCMFVLEE